MQVLVDDTLKQRWPRTALATVSADVRTVETSAVLNELLRARATEILNLPEPRAVLESAAILGTRAGYKALGKDPARYRGSAEALLRRVISGKGLPRINAVVDVINLVSLESRLPIGLYDAAHIQGDVVFRAGLPGETYKGIGKYDLNLECLPLFADAQGPHGSATSDSERTMVTGATTRVLAIIISFNGGDALDRWAQRMVALLTEHAEARNAEIRVIS